MNEKELKTVIIANSFEEFCYKGCRKWGSNKVNVGSVFKLGKLLGYLH